MTSLSLIATVALIHILAAISPGPDFIMVVKNALTYSRKTGIWTAVGLGMGITVHIFYCLAGLAFVISQSIILFSIIKFLGAAYLVYIGFKSITAKASHTNIGEQTKKADLSPLAAVKAGFLTNILNPKVTLFFLGLFTLVITPGTPAATLGIISLIMVVDTILWFSLVATFLTEKRIHAVFEKFQNTFNKIFGGLLIAFGIKVALTQR